MSAPPVPLRDDTAAQSRLPSSPGEFTNAMVHYYRGELSRMAGWRDRIDRTSNWAITVVAAMLSVSLSTPTAHHGVILFAMLLVTLLLFVEARRYRFFDVYRARVRLFERHYFAQVFDPAAEPDLGWLSGLAQGLRRPKFLISPAAALARRLRRNYLWMYLILLLAWVLKISSPKLQEEGVAVDAARPLETILDQAALGPMPGWLVVGVVVVLYSAILILALRGPARAPGGDEVHV